MQSRQAPPSETGSGPSVNVAQHQRSTARSRSPTFYTSRSRSSFAPLQTQMASLAIQTQRTQQPWFDQHFLQDPQSQPRAPSIPPAANGQRSTTPARRSSSHQGGRSHASTNGSTGLDTLAEAATMRRTLEARQTRHHQLGMPMLRGRRNSPMIGRSNTPEEEIYSNRSQNERGSDVGPQRSSGIRSRPGSRYEGVRPNRLQNEWVSDVGPQRSSGSRARSSSRHSDPSDDPYNGDDEEHLQHEDDEDGERPQQVPADEDGEEEELRHGRGEEGHRRVSGTFGGHGGEEDREFGAGPARGNPASAEEVAHLLVGHISTAFNELRNDLQADFGSRREEEVIRDCVRQPRDVPKKTTIPKRKPADELRMAGFVRKHFVKLFGNDVLSQAIDSRVSRDEADTFVNQWNSSGGRIACCSVDDFKVDLDGDPKSAWNRSACHIFALDLINFKRLQRQRYETVAHYFFVRIKALKASYRLRLLGEFAKLQAMIRNRRTGRKQALFQRRLFIATLIPLLRRHIAMLEKLGVDGMSSDESDTEDVFHEASVRQNNPRYRVRKPVWRAEVLDAWLRIFDMIYIIWRRTSGQHLRGAWPHLRERLQDRWSTSKKWVKWLPKNAYRENWLQSRVDADIYVRPTEEEYSFSHDNEIHRQIVVYSDGAEMRSM